MHNEISQLSITVILTAVVRFWLNMYFSITWAPEQVLKRQLSDCQPASPHLERRRRPSLVQA